MPRCAASSRSIRFCWTVRGCGQTLQTYLQSGAWASISASACMTSWAPLDAASPPTVRIMIWSSDTPRASRLEAVRVATYRQHLDIVSLDAIPDVCLLHPVGGDQDQRQSVQHLVVCRDITIGHEPWDGLHPKLLRV